MDICVLNPYFHPYHGGTEKVLLQIYSRLAKRHNISVITSAPEGQKEKSIDHINGIKVIRLPSKFIYAPMLPLPFLVMEGINKAIIGEHAELYHINNRYQYSMSNIRAIKSINARLAITIHNSLPIGIDMLTDTGGLIYDVLFGRQMMRESDIITGVSMYALRSTVPRRYMDKSHVIYNGVDHDLFRPLAKRADIGRKGIIILNNGRLVRQKGQEALIRAFSRLLNNYDARLVIIGRGPLKESLTSLAKRLGVADRFNIATHIKERELPRYYNDASMFVMPSLYEPAGLALLEAMACATPSIASRIGGIPEIMGNCGIYINPNNVNMIYSRIKYGIENYRYMERLAQRARRRVIMHNDWDDIAKKYEKLFSSVRG